MPVLHVEGPETPILRATLGSRVLIPHRLNLLRTTWKQTRKHPFLQFLQRNPTHKNNSLSRFQAGMGSTWALAAGDFPWALGIT